MPKHIAFYLAAIQIIFCLAHWALFAALMFLFPSLLPYRAALAVALGLLSVSFLAVSLLTYRAENIFLRILYIISAVWMPSWFYFLLASLAGLAMYGITGRTGGIMIWPYAIAAAAVIYGIINARITRVRSIAVTLPHLPEAWKGKTIALVSDLHLGHVLKYGFARKIIKKINRMQPELVLIPGDFYDGVKTDFQALANEFKSIIAPRGTYFCSGNHEMFAGMKVCEDALRAAGIRVLENESVMLDGLQLAGLAYDHEISAHLEAKLAGLGLKHDIPNIVLKHVPLQLREVSQAGVNLLLAGHTHGGQVWPFTLATSRYYKKFDYGYKIVNTMQTYISSGAGTWGPPVRIGSISEIVKITLA